MAQTLQIPLSFEFRKRSVEWERADAQLKGWEVGADGTEDRLHLIAQISGVQGARSIKLPVAAFSGPDRKQLLATLNMAQDEAAAVFSSVDLGVFFPKKPLPVVDRELEKHTQPADAWEMRDEFLGMKPSRDSIGGFLNNWGRWHSVVRGYAETREMLGLQSAVRDALISSPDRWFASGNAFLPMMRSKMPKFPYFALCTDACRDAICMATTIDLLRQVEFKTCVRSDCGKPFMVTSKHSRAYCSQYCAHLESVRRSRKPKTVRLKKGA
jgi:hypothetical protein